MKTVLGMSEREYEAVTKTRLRRLLLLCAAAVLLQLFLLFLSGRKLENAGKILTAGLGTLTFGYVFYQWSMGITPRRRLLACFADGTPQCLCGTVEQVSPLLCQHIGLWCYRIELTDIEGKPHELFLPENGALKLQEGTTVLELTVRRSLITAAEADQSEALLNVENTQEDPETLRQKQKVHFSYGWWVYLLVCLAMMTGWNLLFNYVYRNRPNERLQLTFIGSGLDNSSLEAALTEKIEALTDQDIRSLTVESQSNSDQYSAGLILIARSQGMADWIILTESSLDMFGEVSDYFAALDTSVLEEIIGTELTFYEENGSTLGIRLDSGSRFSLFYSGSEACYAFLSKQSANGGSLTEEGNPEDEAALELMAWLLENAE